MRITKITVLFFALFACFSSSAQTWIVPANGSDVATSPQIGITGTGKPQGHLKISAGYPSQIQFFTGISTIPTMSILNEYVSIGTTSGTGFDSQTLTLYSKGGGTGFQGGWARNSALEIISQYPNTSLSIGSFSPKTFYIGANHSSDTIMNLIIEPNTIVQGTLTTGSFKATSKAIIGNPGTSFLPSSDLLEIVKNGGDQFIKFTRVSDGTEATAYGKSGIKFADGASIEQAVFPNYGSGRLNINAGTTAITSNIIHFGTPPEASQSSFVGNFNFNNLVWSKSLVVSDYGSPAPGSFNKIPVGYKFAVNGQSNFLDNVVIGNTSGFTQGLPAGYKLFVADGILTEKVKCAVKTTANWSDFVFAPGYKLTPLKEVEKFIGKNGHLPGVPSAEEVVKEGVDLAQMDALLLQKIEELTLHLISLEKKNELLQKENENIRLQLLKK